MLITLIIPVYNGAKTIGNLIEKIISVIGTQTLQIILVNDGSQDNSHDICYRLYTEYPAILTYINLSKNFGEHNAVMAGLNQAVGDYVVIMDDDFQNPPEEISRLINMAVNNKLDVVYTFYNRKQHNWIRNAGSKFNDCIANFMLDKPKDLYLSSFKCISSFVVHNIIKYKGPFPYIDGLILRCTRNIGKIEVSHAQREEGRSGYTFKKLMGLWLNMFVNFSIIPLRISSLLGLIFSFIGIIMSVLVVIDKFNRPETPLGWSSMMVAIMLFSGAQLIILGLIGEYIGRLFLSYNQTPQFVVHDFFGTKHK